MALEAQVEGGCTGSSELPFATLGDVHRLGAGFCAEPQALERLADVQRYRAFRMRCLATTLHALDACGLPAESVVSVRLKRLDSIRRKISRSGANFRLGTLDDVIGVRVICQSVSAVESLSTRVERSPHFFRTKNYIEAPTATGYRGIHHIMRFDQPAATDRSLAVRYEVQVRTCLQHRWAVWSEDQGEKAKIGKGDDALHEQLRSISREIAHWEADNPQRPQEELPAYSGVRIIAVCWRSPPGPATTLLFNDDVGAAVSWLNHLETAYPAQRENALLLVGVAEHAEVGRVLRRTHPRYVGVPAAHPRFYMPER